MNQEQLNKEVFEENPPKEYNTADVVAAIVVIAIIIGFVFLIFKIITDSSEWSYNYKDEHAQVIYQGGDRVFRLKETAVGDELILLDSDENEYGRINLEDYYKKEMITSEASGQGEAEGEDSR